MRRICVLAAILLGLAAVTLSHAADGNGDVHTEKVVPTPHFFQCDHRAHFPGDGGMYCGPTAISDGLIYLGHHGFTNLLPGGIDDPAIAQIALIMTLAASDYMGTNPDTGTNAGHAVIGIQRYVRESGYHCKRLEYRGWLRMPKEMYRYLSPSPPSLEWMKQAVAEKHSAVWINVGWYVHGSTPNEWKRVGGHFLAVVGYGTDGNGHEDPSIFLLDDPGVPAARLPKPSGRHKLPDGTIAPAPQEVAADAVTLVPLSQGSLIGEGGNSLADAVGVYQVTGAGVHKSPKFDAAFVDGVIVLVIE